MGRTTGKATISFTQISALLRCPRQYRYRYVDRLPSIASGTLVQGRVYHAVVERNYRQKVTSGADLPRDELTDQYAEWFDEALRLEAVQFDRQGPDELRAQGIALIELYAAEIAPAVQPALVEKSFRVSLGDAFPLDLVGRWDLIDDAGFIVDNKTYAKTPSDTDVARDLQLTTYALAYRATFSEIESGLRIDAAVKTKTPKRVVKQTSRTNAQCRWLLRLIEEAVAAIAHQISYPAPGWACGYCDYADRCQPAALQEGA